MDREPDKRRRWELSENVDRAELTVLERAEQIAELIRLEVRPSPDDENRHKSVSVSKGGRGKKGGIRHAAKKLGLNREEARRSVLIAETPSTGETVRPRNTDSPTTSASYKKRRKQKTPSIT